MATKTTGTFNQKHHLLIDCEDDQLLIVSDERERSVNYLQKAKVVKLPPITGPAQAPKPKLAPIILVNIACLLRGRTAAPIARTPT